MNHFSHRFRRSVTASLLTFALHASAGAAAPLSAVPQAAVASHVRVTAAVAADDADHHLSLAALALAALVALAFIGRRRRSD